MIRLKDIDYIYNYPGSSTDYFQGNVGDKIRAVIAIEIFSAVIASTGETLIYNNNDGYIAGAGEGWITDDSNRFVDFNVGDTIKVYDYIASSLRATCTILEKQDDGAIKVDTDFSLGSNVPITGDVISLVQDYESVKMKFNLIENNEQVNYISKVDGSDIILKADYLDASVVTPVDFTPLGNKSWQLGDAKITGNGISTVPIYKNTFIIEHNFVVTPFYKPINFDDLNTGIRPDYFKDDACLKYIFNLEAKRTNNSTITPQFFEYLNEGNSGEFNENFNTGLTNYFFDNLEFFDTISASIPSIELTTDEQTITFKVKNTIDNPFSNGNTKGVFSICQAPANDTDVANLNKTIKENYFFDLSAFTLNDTFIPGENFGLTEQVIKEAKATFISSSEILVTVKIKMDLNVVTKIQNQQDKNYLIWFSVSNHSLSIGNTDRVSLKLAVNPFYINPKNDGLIVFDSTFLEEPNDDYITEGINNPDTFPHSEVVAYTDFYIDKSIIDFGSEVLITHITAKIKAKNTVSNETFDLDVFNLDTTFLPLIGGNQFINYALDRPFHVPVAEKIKQITIKRRPDLDLPDQYYYSVKFPFLVHWEYWQALSGVDNDFFDPLEPNNGQNNFWERFDNITNWKVFYDLTLTVKKDGSTFLYTEEKQININDYNSNSNYFNKTIKSYDNANTDLFDGVDKRFIIGYEDTKIKAVFEKSSAFDPLNTHMVIDIEVFESGGVTGRRRISSTHPKDGDTWFLDVDGSGKIKLTFTGNQVIGECLLDRTQLPSVALFTCTATLYDNAEEYKLFQDGDAFLFQDGDNYKFQDQ